MFTFHWRDDPRKNLAWYNDKKLKWEESIVAQELDIDYTASLEGVCIKSKWVQAAVDFHKRHGLSTSGARVSGFDVSDEGNDMNAHVSRHGFVVVHIDDWSGKGSTVGKSTGRCYQQAEELKVDLINFDNIGVGAGVKSEAENLRLSKTNPIKVLGINAGSTKLIGKWEEGKKNSDMFVNQKALMWWTVRLSQYCRPPHRLSLMRFAD